MTDTLIYATPDGWRLVNEWIEECGSTETFTPHNYALTAFETFNICKAAYWYELDIDTFIKYEATS